MPMMRATSARKMGDVAASDPNFDANSTIAAGTQTLRQSCAHIARRYSCRTAFSRTLLPVLPTYQVGNTNAAGADCSPPQRPSASLHRLKKDGAAMSPAAQAWGLGPARFSGA